MSQRKIMVVDDDATTRYMMSEFLDVLGHEHVVVSSGPACLAELTADPMAYNLILLDIHMLILTGVHTALSIRQFEKDPPQTIPIVAITADTNYHQPTRIKELGMNAVLPKPVNIDALHDMLSELTT